MNSNHHGLGVGVVRWKKPDAINRLISRTFNELGCRVTHFPYDGPLPENTDVIFLFGPYGTLVSVVDQMRALPAARRPILAILHAEQFPNPFLPEIWRRPVGMLRSQLERWLVNFSNSRGRPLPPGLQPILTKGVRYRYYGDIYWLKKLGLKYLVIGDSPWTVNFLRQRGINAIPILGFGFPLRPKWGADLGLERDIPVLWLGKYGTRRRKRLLTGIRAELRAHGIEMLVIDGVENPYVFGEQRTELLNRTKIVLNLLRAPWDNNAGRFYLAALNRALNVTEPMLPHTPAFVPGKHLVEAPVPELVATIRHYLEDAEARDQITDQAFQLVTTDLTIQKTVRHILEAIRPQIDSQG